MSRKVLIVSTMQGIELYAEQIAEQTGCEVEVAGTKRAALATLTRVEFDVVVVEQSLVDGDPEWADRLWQKTGTAMPVPLNFAISGASRLVREVRAALTRRTADRTLARQAVALDLANELKSPLTGLLLQSELALRDPAMPPAMEPKLRHLVELASQIRERLRPEG
jgi:DNA-binding NtrC family response regulator